MRAQRPVSEAHLVEAVRRGLVTADQAEALLALARSDDAPAGALPDLRWTTVVLSVAAAVTVLVPGFALLLVFTDNPASYPAFAVGAACAVAFVLCAAGGRVVRARGWGRAPAAILTAGAAPYAGGAAMFLLDAGWRGILCALPTQLDTRFSMDLVGLVRTQALLTLVATLVASAVGFAFWRAWRSATVLSAAGFCLPFAAMSAARAAFPGDPMTPYRLVMLATAFAGLAVAAARPAWGRRGGVDGASWWELGTFAAAAVVATVGFDEGLGGAAVWVPVALAVAALGVRTDRWTYQLAGALGLPLFVWLGLRDEPTVTRAAGLVAVAVVIAAATQRQRRRASTRVVAAEPASYWE